MARSKRIKPIFAPEELTLGRIFSTPYEKGCKVTREPIADPLGGWSFLGLDSDGVECSYGLEMVSALDDNPSPKCDGCARCESEICLCHDATYHDSAYGKDAR